MSHSATSTRTLSTDRLRASLHEASGTARPDYLTDIVAQAGRTRQRPAWTFLERWHPMDIAERRQGVPRAVLVFAVLALLVALLVGTLAFVGTQTTKQTLPAAATNGLIAFTRGGNILLVNPDGTGQRPLVTGVSESGMAFSPDGERLAYWSGPLTDTTNDLIVVNADGSNPVTVASGVPEITSPTPAWSPDGTQIAYSARTAQAAGSTPCPGHGQKNGDFCTSRIFLAAVDGSGARQVGDPNLDARSPDWSPDGSTIAFGGGNATPGLDVRLYLMNADGTNVRQLSDVIGTDWAFVRVDWSYDGTKIVGQASDADNLYDWDIWIIPVDGSAPTNVGAHTGGDEVLPTWAPDRNALAWTWDGVVLMEDGADPVDIPMPGGLAVWSPDGKLIAMASEDGVNVTDLAGNVQTIVEGQLGSVAWQPVFD